MRYTETATRGVLLKKGVLKNSTKFTGKQTLESLRPATLLKKRLWHRCSLVNFVKFLRTPLLQNTSRLLLFILCIHFIQSSSYFVSISYKTPPSVFQRVHHGTRYFIFVERFAYPNIEQLGIFFNFRIWNLLTIQIH